MTGDSFVCIDGYIGSAFFDEIVEDKKNIYKSTTYKKAGEYLQRNYNEKAISHIVNFRNHFKDDYYLEINQIDTESFPASQLISNIIIEISNSTSLKFKNIIAGANICYGKRSDAKDHRVLLCSKMKTTLKDVDKKLAIENNYKYSRFFQTSSSYIPSKDRISKYEKQYIKTLDEINAKCSEYNILSAPILPDTDTKNNLSQIEYLKELCREGWKNILIPSGKVSTKEKVEEYKKRVLDELEIIEEANLSGYFLIVQDYVNEFRNRNILVGPGRGSAAGSLVSYLIGITLIDPVEYGLIFSRFYNKSRVGSLPDIDVDFPPAERNNVITYLKEKYGYDKVCQMVTFGRLQGRSALKEVLRVNQSCSFDQMNEITEKIPQEAAISDQLQEMENPSVISWALDNNADTLKEFCWIENGELHGDFKRDFEQALRIEGIFKTQGKHAAGVVVSSIELNNLCPMVKQTKGDEKIAGLEMNDLEAVGAVKFDILGVSCLQKIDQTMKM